MSINASIDRELKKIFDRATKDIIEGFKKINNTWYNDFNNAFKNLGRVYSNKNNPLDFWYYYENKIAKVIPKLVPRKLKRMGIVLKPDDLVSANETEISIEYDDRSSTINFNAYMDLVEISDLAKELGYSYNRYKLNDTEEDKTFFIVDTEFDNWFSDQYTGFRGYSYFFRKIEPKLSMIEKEIEEKYQDYFDCCFMNEKYEHHWNELSFYFKLVKWKR